MTLQDYKKSHQEAIKSQERFESRLTDAYGRYADGYTKAIESLKGEALENKINKLWNEWHSTSEGYRSSCLESLSKAYNDEASAVRALYAEAPSSDVNNVLTALSLRSTLDSGDVESAVTALKGSIMGLSTLKDIVNRIAPDAAGSLKHIPTLSDAVKAIDGQREARTESVRNFLNIAPGQTDALDAMRNYLFDPESGLQSYFKLYDFLTDAVSE